jgi:hypothetical protein
MRAYLPLSPSWALQDLVSERQKWEQELVDRAEKRMTEKEDLFMERILLEQQGLLDSVINPALKGGALDLA